MKRFWQRPSAAIWSGGLILLASATFLLRLGEGLLGGVRTNFFVDTLGLTGGQVLWLEGIRELRGLGLMLVAALTMRLPLSRRAAASVLVMGTGSILYAVAGSYAALLVVAVIASLGMHMWMPLGNALGMCLSAKEKTGRVLGTLASVGALATLAGMGLVSLVSKLWGSLSLGVYYIVGGAVIVGSALLIAKLPTDIGAAQTRQPRMLLKRRYWLYYVCPDVFPGFTQASLEHLWHLGAG